MNKNAEDRNARLEAILEAAVDGIITIDSAGLIEDVNPAVLAMFGYTADELIGQNVKILMPEPFGRAHDGYVERYLATAEKKIIGIGREATGRRKDGSTFPIDLAVSEFLIAGKKYFAGIVKDLTERVAAEAMATRLGRIIEDSTNEVYVFAADTLKFLMVNHGARRNLGYNSEELRELTPADIKPEYSLQEFVRLIEPLRHGDRERIEFQTVHRRKDGTTYNVDVRLQLSTRETPPVFVAIIEDITSQRQANEALRLRESAIVATDSGILITDPNQDDNPIVFANPAVEKMTGYSRAELIGRNARMLQGKDHDQPELKQIHAAMQTGNPVHVVVRNYRKDGKLFLADIRITPIRDNDIRITHFVCVLTDVTERRALEEQFRHSQRLDAVGQLTGGIAHDFNNLLTVIIGNNELLEARLEKEGDLELLQEAQEAAELGATLTDRLLTFARRQPLAPQVVNLNEHVLNLMELLRRTLGEAIDLSTVLASDLWPTLADPGQIENVLLNLALNARDAMQGTGRLMIETTNAVIDNDYAAKEIGLTPGDFTLLSVSDTGCGMSDEEKAHAFEPFFTTKPPGSGSGLGLSMIYGFAKSSGGHVSIYSEQGVGTTINLYLPKDMSVEPARAVAEAPVAGAPGNGEVILVVEDDERVRRLSVKRLKELGYNILEASDGPSALTILETEPDIDLLFTDLVMPGGMSGHELSERAKALRPVIKILVTSGYTEDFVRHETGLYGSTIMLRKPYRTVDLAKAISQTLDID
jgi:PAS domain S-box-containing protein